MMDDCDSKLNEVVAFQGLFVTSVWGWRGR